MLPTSTRWRLNISATQSGASVSVAALQLAEVAGGPDLCVGGTPSASSVWDSTFTAAKAFDGVSTTRWNNGPANTPVLPAWLEYQFPSAVTIVEYRIQAPDVVPQSIAPKAWTFEYWDGALWQGVADETAQTGWTVGQVRAFRVVDPATVDIRLTSLGAEALTQNLDAEVRLTSAAAEVLTQNPDAEVRLTSLSTEALTQNSSADVRLTSLFAEALRQRPTAQVRLTRLTVEVLYLRDPTPPTAVRLTNLYAEVLIGPEIPPAPARVTQQAAEVLRQDRPVITAVSQDAVEVLHRYTGPLQPARATQAAVEAIHQYTGPLQPARVTHDALEVLHRYTGPMQPARTSQVALEIIYPFACWAPPPPPCAVDVPIASDSGGGPCQVPADEVTIDPLLLPCPVDFSVDADTGVPFCPTDPFPVDRDDD